MAQLQTIHASSRPGWRWLLVVAAGLAWLSIGCSPQSLSIFLMPFVDNNKDPDYKLFAADKELNLVILSNFVHKQFQPEYIPADHELAEHVTSALRKRCQENKHKLKVVPQAEVRSYQMKMLAEGDVSPIEIGKKFKADYVLDLSIEAFSLYQKDGYPKMYRGTAQINVRLYDVKTKDEDPVYRRSYTGDYGGGRGIPLEVGNSNPADFRQLFMRRIGRDISRTFIAFPMDELKEWD